MVPHKQIGVCQTMLEALHNQQSSCGRNVVENSFGILQKMFKEILQKTNVIFIFFAEPIPFVFAHFSNVRNS
jgi:hypothetical protein